MDMLRVNPGSGWYLAFSVPFMAVVLLPWLIFKYLLAAVCLLTLGC